ncbi:hypothetical protein R3P38DRAFT_3206325 [Favolaschia claudopus]|uniref:Uncharacterized protein n=1 Tax=Favolaschia claudopus TaxID=2862362 RepID=A0AAW0AMG9_9AGAR
MGFKLEWRDFCFPVRVAFMVYKGLGRAAYFASELLSARYKPSAVMPISDAGTLPWPLPDDIAFPQLTASFAQGSSCLTKLEIQYQSPCTSVPNFDSPFEASQVCYSSISALRTYSYFVRRNPVVKIRCLLIPNQRAVLLRLNGGGSWARIHEFVCSERLFYSLLVPSCRPYSDATDTGTRVRFDCGKYTPSAPVSLRLLRTRFGKPDPERQRYSPRTRVHTPSSLVGVNVRPALELVPRASDLNAIGFPCVVVDSALPRGL